MHSKQKFNWPVENIVHHKKQLIASTNVYTIFRKLSRRHIMRFCPKTMLSTVSFDACLIATTSSRLHQNIGQPWQSLHIGLLAFLPKFHLVVHGMESPNGVQRQPARFFGSEKRLRSLKAFSKCQQISFQKSTPLISDFRGHVS